MSFYLGVDSQISSPLHERQTGTESSSQGARSRPYLCTYSTKDHAQSGPASQRPLAEGGLVCPLQHTSFAVQQHGLPSFSGSSLPAGPC